MKKILILAAILLTGCTTNREIYFGQTEVTMYARENGIKHFMYKGDGLIKIKGKKDIYLQIYENDSLTLEIDYKYLPDTIQLINYTKLETK